MKSNPPIPKKRWTLPPAPGDSTSPPVLYHVTNRVLDGRPVFGDPEKAKFIELMRACETFSGCRVLSYCVMGNHYHLMLEMPPPPAADLDEAELITRVRAIYGEERAHALKLELKTARQSSRQSALEIQREFTDRMYDLSDFVKTLNQRFARWHNRHSARNGALFESPFRSIVVEPGNAARLVAGYIELNPLRAGIVEDPTIYPWSSYGEAMGAAGKKTTAKARRARAGIVRAFFAHEPAAEDAGQWQVCHDILRAWTQDAIAEISASIAPGEAAPGDPASPGKALAHRIRHFTEGIAVGGHEFIEHFFELHRSRFNRKRTHGAKIIRGPLAALAKRQSLFTLRNFQNGQES